MITHTQILKVKGILTTSLHLVKKSNVSYMLVRFVRADSGRNIPALDPDMTLHTYTALKNIKLHPPNSFELEWRCFPADEEWDCFHSGVSSVSNSRPMLQDVFDSGWWLKQQRICWRFWMKTVSYWAVRHNKLFDSVSTWLGSHLSETFSHSVGPSSEDGLAG